MNTTTNSLLGKLVACSLIIVCLLAGAVGLVLPVIPGVIFLAIAALIAARHFPAIERQLRRSQTLGRHLDRANGVAGLTFRRKIQLGGLVCIKILLEGIASISSFVTRLRNPPAQR